MEVVIIGGNFGFPFGGAAANRVRLLSLGLKENGANVRVLHFTCSEKRDSILNRTTKGQYRGVKYEYTTGTTVLSQYFLFRRWIQLKGLVAGLMRIVQLYLQGRLDVVYLYAKSSTFTIPVVSICRILSIPVILDICEWYPSFPNCSELEECIYMRFTLRSIDGAVPISEFLSRKLDYLNTRRYKKLQKIKVPILIDTHEWESHETQVQANSETYVLWCGDIAGYSHVVKFLMHVILELYSKGVNVKLRLVGSLQPSKLNELRKYQESKGLPKSMVEFTGYISQEELRKQYLGALALLLPLDEIERDLARFPTKLGEYLASGRPVVASGIGELTLFLTHGVNTILCRPGDEKEFAAGIELVMKSPQDANRIGRAGKDLSESVFGYKEQGRRLLEFLLGVCKDA